MVETVPNRPQKGRGAVSNRSGRYEALERVAAFDGWESGSLAGTCDADNTSEEFTSGCDVLDLRRPVTLAMVPLVLGFALGVSFPETDYDYDDGVSLLVFADLDDLGADFEADDE